MTTLHRIILSAILAATISLTVVPFAALAGDDGQQGQSGVDEPDGDNNQSGIDEPDGDNANE